MGLKTYPQPQNQVSDILGILDITQNTPQQPKEKTIANDNI